jgi:DNA-binding NarL/FixJ family response regulator
MNNGNRCLDRQGAQRGHLYGSITGIEVAKVIKETYHYPFIFLTALADTATLDEVKTTMPYGYIVKPFSDHDLRSRIELALYRFQQQQDTRSLPTLSQLNERLLEPLSTREYEVMQLLEEGLTYREIGEQLFIGYNTVKTYQKSLFIKLEVSSRHQMSQWLRQYAS